MRLLPLSAGKLVVGEDRATGSVATAVYGRYIGYMGTLTVIFISGGRAAYSHACTTCMRGRLGHCNACL